MFTMFLFVADGAAWFSEQTDRSRLGSESAGDDYWHGIRRHQGVSFSFAFLAPCLRVYPHFLFVFII